MPKYYFENTETNETFYEYMTIAEMEEFIKTENIKILPSAPFFSYHNYKKPTNEFRDVLKHIKKNNRGSTINTF